MLCLGLLATPYQKFALLPPVALIGVMLLSRYPTFGLYLIVVLIPFWGFRAVAGPVQLHWLVAAVLVTVLVLQHAVRRELPRTLRSRLWAPFGLFLLIGTISALLSPHRTTALIHLVRLAMAATFVALLLLLLKPRGFVRTLPAVMILSVSLSSLLAVLGFYSGLDLFVVDPGEAEFTRGSGGARGAVNLAFLIISIIPLIGYWLYFERRGWRRLAAVALLLVNLLALFTTFSRGGGMLLILITVGMMLEFLPFFRVRHLLLLIGASAFVLALALPAAPDYYWERLGLLGSSRDKASQRRLSYYTVGRQAIARRPLLGSGLGSFREIYATTSFARKFARTDKERYRFAHNTYLEVLVGSGFIGLAAYLALLWVGWSNFTRAKRLLLIRKQRRLALLVASYRLSYLGVLSYLFLKSGVDNKSLLLGLGLSVVACRVASGPLPRPE